MSYIDILHQPGLYRDQNYRCFQSSCGKREAEHPRSFVRGSGQFLYCPANKAYLDCIGSVSHVGHSHPKIIAAIVSQLGTKVAHINGQAESSNFAYPKELLDTLPESIDSIHFCSSGTEAVDLALQLARLYTKGNEVICMEGSFHGATESVNQVSTRLPKMNKEDWVNDLPIPMAFNGPSEEDSLNELKRILNNISQRRKKLSCFLAESIFTMMGCLVPPTSWIQEVYKIVHEANGLCIVDEVQSGFGRIGSHFWAFESLNLKPDIVVIGKSIGNGYPMAAVATRKEISNLLGDRLSTYLCSPVANVVGSAVLEVLRTEQLMSNARRTGAALTTSLQSLHLEYKCIGALHGRGLLLGIEIVCPQTGRASKAFAQTIVTRMREKGILLALEGSQGNVILVMPPICFTIEDANVFCRSLQEILNELRDKAENKESGFVVESLTSRGDLPPQEGRVGILQKSAKEPEGQPPSALGRSYCDPD